MSRPAASRLLQSFLSEQGATCQLLLLVAVSAALYFLLGPGGSFFLGEVNSSQLVLARDARTPTPFPDASHFYFWLAHRVWGPRPWAFHLANWALHLTNVILLYLVARRVGLAARAALAGALLFAVHHAAAEVLFVTARFDVLLATALTLGSFLLLDRHLETGSRACRWLHVALFLVALQISAWVAGALALMAVHAWQRSLGDRAGARLKAAARALWPLFSLLAALVALTLLSVLSPFKAHHPLPDGLARLAAGIICFADHPLPRLAGVGAALERILIPFDHQSATHSLAQAATAQSVAGALALLGGLLVLLVVIRPAAVRLSLWWLLATPLPLLLLQDQPCAPAIARGPALYLPLMGACLLWALVVLEAGARLGRQGWVNWSLVLLLTLLVPLTLSWAGRARQRRVAGEVVAAGLRMTGRVLPPRQRPKVIYTFLPREIYRYQAFSGRGDLVQALMPRFAHGVSPTWYFSIPPHQASSSQYDLYHYLGLVSHRSADLETLRRDLPLGSGIDSRLPMEWPRHVFAYHDSPRPGISALTRRVLPRTRVELAVTAGPEVKQLFVRGSFNRWARSRLVYRDGAWRGQLTLPHGLHRFQLQADAGCYLLPGPTAACGEAGARCSVLAVVNPALPVGLLAHHDARVRQQVLALRARVLQNPLDPLLRLQLAGLYRRLGLRRAAWLERVEAGAMIRSRP